MANIVVYKHPLQMAETGAINILLEKIETELLYKDVAGDLQVFFFDNDYLISGLTTSSINGLIAFYDEVEREFKPVLPPAPQNENLSITLFFYLHSGSTFEEADGYNFDISMFFWYDTSRFNAYSITTQLRKAITNSLEFNSVRGPYSNCQFFEVVEAFGNITSIANNVGREEYKKYFLPPYGLLQVRFNAQYHEF